MRKTWEQLHSFSEELANEKLNFRRLTSTSELPVIRGLGPCVCYFGTSIYSCLV